MSAKLLIALAAVLLCGCAREARLYPQSLQGRPASSGPITAKFTDSGMGKGPIELTMPDGEVLKGEFSTTDTSTYGFGTAFSATRYSPIITTASAAAVPGSMPGIVTALGTNGTSMRCEYLVNSFTGSGAGTCQTNRGDVYDMHF